MVKNPRILAFERVGGLLSHVKVVNLCRTFAMCCMEVTHGTHHRRIEATTKTAICAHGYEQDAAILFGWRLQQAMIGEARLLNDGGEQENKLKDVFLMSSVTLSTD